MGVIALRVLPGLTLYRVPADNFFYVMLLHNAVVGVGIGVVTCALTTAQAGRAKGKAYVSTGAAGAVVAILVGYSYSLIVAPLATDVPVAHWVIHGVVGFAVGLLICRLKLQFNARHEHRNDRRLIQS